MKIIKILLVLCIAVAFQISADASSFFRKKIKPSGEVVTKTFSIPSSSYKKIDVSSVVRVTIVEGSGDIVVKIDSNLESYVIVEVSDDELEIDLEDNVSVKGDFKFEVIVPCNSELNEISASGVSSVVSKVVLTGDDISVSANGVSNVTAVADGENCEVEASGVSNVTLEVKTNNLEADASGVSNLTLSGEVNHAEISASGTSNVRAKGLNYKTINVDKSGVSSISYKKN